MNEIDYKAYNYRPAYIKSMDKDADPNSVCTPAMRTGYQISDGPPPIDAQLNDLVDKFRAGKITCRKATVAMFWIRPDTDYNPHITEKYRQYIDVMDSFGGDNYRKGSIPIVLYEHEGQLIMGDDYKTYWVHRSDESWTVQCLILGDFTERDFCRGHDEPFTVDSFDLTVKDELMDSDTRRIALLLRGEQVRIETKQEREAINKKDLEDELKKPVEYEPDWVPMMNQHGEDPQLVFTPPLHEGHFFGPLPEDERYAELAEQAQAGNLDCQLATVTLAMMRPYSDYKPVLSDEFRMEFEERYEEENEMRITLYEYEPGHFMVSGSEENYAVYALLKEKQSLYETCIILGPYTKTWAVAAIDKPFQVTLSPQAGYDPEQTLKLVGKRIYDIMCEKGLYLGELARLTGIDIDDIDDIVGGNYSKPKLPSVEQLELICRVLGVQASDILQF